MQALRGVGAALAGIVAGGIANAAGAASPPAPVRYVCADGRLLDVLYPDRSTVLITMGGPPLKLTIAPSADGARYTGGGWQWWSKGMHHAMLAPLLPGETIASAPGAPCHT